LGIIILLQKWSEGRESGEVYKSAVSSDITVEIYGNVDRTKTKQVSGNKNIKAIRKSASFLVKFDLKPHQTLLFCYSIFHVNFLVEKLGNTEKPSLQHLPLWHRVWWRKRTTYLSPQCCTLIYKRAEISDWFSLLYSRPRVPIGRLSSSNLLHAFPNDMIYRLIIHHTYTDWVPDDPKSH
jgi:hypothetical protein